jgi:glycosyltransferase involved in cell wall biosynthesis
MIKVFLVCSGLGRVNRGFESFTEECFDTLSKDSSVEIILFKGGGKFSKKTRRLWNLPRDSWMALQLGKVIDRSAYFIEQASFTFSLLPYIYREKPDVIYFSDGDVGSLLCHWRRLTKQSYKLLLSNGGPFFLPFLPDCDHVQQLTPSHFQTALDAGWSAAKQSLVPYGINISTKLRTLSIPEREALKFRLELFEKQPIILSVGAINKSHKRMDYLIRETATLPEPRPYLLLLGQQDSESPEIINLGNELLGADNFNVRTVTSSEIENYYRVADIFVLTSLREGFGRVLVEAMSYGLPCLAHDYEITRFVLGNEGYLGNFELVGSLTGLISQVLAEGDDESKRRFRHRSVYNRFSWEKLRPSYIEMIQRCVANSEQSAIALV